MTIIDLLRNIHTKGIGFSRSTILIAIGQGMRSVPQLMLDTGLAWRTIHHHVADLRKEGYIEIAEKHKRTPRGIPRATYQCTKEGEIAVKALLTAEAQSHQCSLKQST